MVVLLFVFYGDTLIIVSPFLSYGGIANQTRCIDDRLSFERARHRQKKKAPPLVFPGEAKIFRDMYTQVGEEEQIISPPYTRIQEDVRRRGRKKRKQGDDNALMG